MSETTAKKGDTVKVHYVGTFDDGTVFDSSRQRGETLEFKVGSGQMIPGFDTAVATMATGEVKNVSLKSEEAYGPVNPDAFVSVTKKNFPEDFEVKAGIPVTTQTPSGQPAWGVIDKVDGDDVVVNMNHPMAGKDLNFEIELVEVVSSDPDTTTEE